MPRCLSRSNRPQVGLQPLQVIQGHDFQTLWWALATLVKNLIVTLAYSSRPVKYNVLKGLYTVFPVILLPAAFSQDL